MEDHPRPDLLAAAAALYPSRVALRAGGDQWTFGDLDYTASEIASRVATGSRIAFRAEMSIASVAAIWGIPRGGGIAVPIDPQLDVAAAAAAAHAVGATLGWPDPPAPGKGDPDPDPDRTVLIVLTSGTGGTARGVRLTKGNVEAAAAASQVHLGTRQSDVWLLVMPLHHVAGLAIIWRAAHDGAEIVMHENFDAVAVDEALHGEATWVSLVPTMLRRLLRSGRGPWPHVRGALIGGAHASDALIDAATVAGLPALATYGMTETAAQACTVRPSGAAAARGTVGHPLPGVEIAIDAAPGEPGTISIAGPTVSPGYVDGPARQGPFVTHDVGFFDQTGRLVVLGRSDDVIVTGGENVHPATVERALLTLPEVADAVAFGMADEEWGERIIAVVVAPEVSPDLLLSRLAELLPRQAVPKQLRIVDELPYLSNGKIDRAAVQAAAAG